MDLKKLNLLRLILRLLLILASPVACTTTLGAPRGDDAYDAESATEAMEEEEEEDAWEETNR